MGWAWVGAHVRARSFGVVIENRIHRVSGSGVRIRAGVRVRIRVRG